MVEPLEVGAARGVADPRRDDRIRLLKFLVFLLHLFYLASLFFLELQNTLMLTTSAATMLYIDCGYS